MRGDVTAFIGTPVQLGRKHVLHKTALKAAAGYMYIAALRGQSVRAVHVQSLTALTMLLGHWVGYLWCQLRGRLYHTLEPELKVRRKESMRKRA